MNLKKFSKKDLWAALVVEREWKSEKEADLEREVVRLRRRLAEVNVVRLLGLVAYIVICMVVCMLLV